jgi:hypothetical protein
MLLQTDAKCEAGAAVGCTNNKHCYCAGHKKIPACQCCLLPAKCDTCVEMGF